MLEFGELNGEGELYHYFYHYYGYYLGLWANTVTVTVGVGFFFLIIPLWRVLYFYIAVFIILSFLYRYVWMPVFWSTKLGGNAL